MSGMNYVDYAILAIFFISILIGFKRGLVREVISLLTWIAAFIVAIMFSSHLAGVFTSTSVAQNVMSNASSGLGVDTGTSFSYAALAISFVALFVGTLLAGSIVNYFISYAVEGAGISIGNRLLGGLFGLGRGFIVNLVIIFIIQLTPLATEPMWTSSKFVTAFQPGVQWLANLVSPSLAGIKAKIGETIENVNSNVSGAAASVYQGWR